jgi:hypothetical protein
MLAFGLKGPWVAPSCRKTFSFLLTGLHRLKQAFWSKVIGQVSISEDVFRLHVSISRRERRREGERDTVKGRMIKRSLRTASVLRYSTRTKHYKLNRIWAFGIRKFNIKLYDILQITPFGNLGIGKDVEDIGSSRSLSEFFDLQIEWKFPQLNPPRSIY